MKFLLLAFVLGFAGTVLGQPPTVPPMIRATMQTPPRYWATPDGGTVAVRFLEADRGKVQLLVGDAPVPRIVTIQTPRLDGDHRNWISQELNRRAGTNWNAEANRSLPARYRYR